MIRRPPISLLRHLPLLFLFFFNDTATTEIYTLSLHDALPISALSPRRRTSCTPTPVLNPSVASSTTSRTSTGSRRSGRSPAKIWKSCKKRSRDRKSTRLNSSHTVISYAVFCLKKKKIDQRHQIPQKFPSTPQRNPSPPLLAYHPM